MCSTVYFKSLNQQNQPSYPLCARPTCKCRLKSSSLYSSFNAQTYFSFAMYRLFSCQRQEFATEKSTIFAQLYSNSSLRLWAASYCFLLEADNCSSLSDRTLVFCSLKCNYSLLYDKISFYISKRRSEFFINFYCLIVYIFILIMIFNILIIYLVVFVIIYQPQVKLIAIYLIIFIYFSQYEANLSLVVFG